MVTDKRTADRRLIRRLPGRARTAQNEPHEGCDERHPAVTRLLTFDLLIVQSPMTRTPSSGG